MRARADPGGKMQFTHITKLITEIVGNITDQSLTLFRPCTQGGYGYFYDILALDPEEVQNMSFPVASMNSPLVALPVSYQPVYDYNEFRASKKFTFFRPVAPEGFAALGLVAAESADKIPDNILCVRASLVAESDEISIIKVFNPFGVYVEINRTSALQSEIGRSPAVLLEAVASNQNSFMMQLDSIAQSIRFCETEKLVLPLMDFNDCKDFAPAALPDPNENDNMRDVSVFQGHNGCGMQLSNFQGLCFTESEYFQPAQSFELVGVTSLTKPAQEVAEEQYVYVFRPIAPPGFVPLSLVLSLSETCDYNVFCVSERLTMTTHKAARLGSVYSADTAAYILNFTTLKNSGEANAEIARKQRKLGAIQPTEEQLVVPRGALGCIQLSCAYGYAILLPTVLAFVNCQLSVSQKSLIKAIKQSKEPEFVGQFPLDANRGMLVFQPRLEKSHYSTIIQSVALRNVPEFDFSALSKADSKQNQWPYAETQRAQNCYQVRPPERLPVELSVVAHSTQFEAQTLAEPYDAHLVADSGSGAARIRLFKLIPPPGFCVLSDAVWVGEGRFEKERFACVNSSFCQAVKAKPICAVGAGFQLATSVWPYGTLELQQSEYSGLHFVERNADFDDYNIWILKDNVFQAHVTQEQMQASLKYYGKNVSLDKASLEVQLLSKSLLEIGAKEIQVCGKLYLVNLTEQQFLSFGSISVVFDYFFGQERNADDAAESKPKLTEFDDIYEDFEDSARRMLVTSYFASEIAPCGVWAKPREVKRIGSFDYAGKTMYIYSLVPCDNFVALGDIITDQELLQAEQFVTVHKSFVDFSNVDCPSYYLSGYFDTDGLWIYETNGRVFVFPFPEEHIYVPCLKRALLRAVNNQSKHQTIYPHSDGIVVADPSFYYNLFASFAHNNKISLNALKVYDFNINQFDANAVNDPLCKTAAFVSVSNMRLFNTNYRLSGEIIQPVLKQEQMALQPLSNEYATARARLLASIYDMLEVLNLVDGFSYFGKRTYLAFKVADCEFVALSDKIPLSPQGGYFLGEGCLIKHCIFEKFCAKCIGNYNKMYEMDEMDLVKVVFGLFGMNSNAKGSWIFDIYLHNGVVQADEQEGSIPIRVWKE